jgi:cytochrome c-type biogenesis protein CcmH
MPQQPLEEGASLWRDQRAELERSLELGTIEPDEYEAQASALTQAAQSDLTGASRTDLSPLVTAGPTADKRRLGVALGIVLVVLAIALPLYSRLGTPDASSILAASVIDESGAAAAPGAPATTDPAVIQMVQSLAQKMKDHPEDPKGWMLLGRSYMWLHNYGDAVKSYRHAVALVPADASAMADLADARAMEQGGRLDGEPNTLIAKALGIEPNNPKALELAGSAALQLGDVKSARDYWMRLKAQLAPGSDDARQVDAAIAQIDQAVGNAPAVAAVNPQAAVSAPPAATPSVDTLRQSQTAAAEGPTINGSVDIAPAMAGQVALTDVVYLSARASKGDASAGRIPLAVMRLEARQLPATFSLSDAEAMDPAHKLSGASEVVIEAHIAKHGTPITTAGDLAAKPVTVKLGASGVTLVIDHVVP